MFFSREQQSNKGTEVHNISTHDREHAIKCTKKSISLYINPTKYEYDAVDNMNVKVWSSSVSPQIQHFCSNLKCLSLLIYAD